MSFVDDSKKTSVIRALCKNLKITRYKIRTARGLTALSTKIEIMELYELKLSFFFLF